VRHADRLETACQALGRPLLEEQRRRSEQDDAERPSGRRVLVPQALDLLGPVRQLLDLVDRENRATAPAFARLLPAQLPLLSEPALRQPARVVSGGVVPGQGAFGKRLSHEGRLADLAWTNHDLRVVTPLGDPFADELGFGTDHLRHGYEQLRIMSKINQRRE